MVALPLAAGVLAAVGFVLAPAVGAVLMTLSTIIVALNAQTLRRLDLRAGERHEPEAHDANLPHNGPQGAVSMGHHAG